MDIWKNILDKILIEIVYKKVDLRYIFLRGPKSEMEQLEEYLNRIPQYMFMPSFAGVRQAEVYLNKFRSKNGETIYYCHSGLWRTIYIWASQHQVQINGIDDYFKYFPQRPDLQTFTKIVKSWNLSLDPYDYQVKAAWMILQYRQSLSELATRAGKTLIAYMVFRYLMEYCGVKNILMIVPSIYLIKQGVADFSEYQEFFKTETVWAKSEFCACSNLTIGTYQSLVQRADKKSKKYDPKFFDKFDCVLVDEAHHLVCKSINTILNLPFLKHIKLKFGFTGTLPKEETIESFACHALMGPTIQIIHTMQLVEQGFLAKPKITQIRIKHPMTPDLLKSYIRCGEYLCSSYKLSDGKPILLPKEQREFTIQHEKYLPDVLKQVKPLYTDQEYYMYLVDLCKAKGANLLALEQMLLHRDPRRVQYMIQIINGLKKNVIVFAHHSEYLKYLTETFREAFPDRIVKMIKGDVNLKRRQRIIDEMLTNDNVILVASYGCISTGVTFKNVDYGILAQSFKSEIINLQSIGRGLLKTSSKDKFVIFDMVDEFPTGRLAAQGKEKVKTYEEEGFDYHIVTY